MGKIVLGMRNLIDRAVLTAPHWGGSELRLQNRVYADQAETVDLDPAKCWLDIEFERPVEIGLIALIRHNLTAQGRMEAIALDGGQSSGPVAVWPKLPMSMRQYGEQNFWDGQLDPERLELYPANWPLLFKARSKAWRIKFNDTTNPDGRIKLGRIFQGPTWSPLVNKDWGGEIGYQNERAATRSRSGVVFNSKRPKYREATFNLSWLTKDEANGILLDMDVMVGTDEELYYIDDPEDPVYLTQNAFPCQLTALSKAKRHGPNRYERSFALEELK